MKIPERVDLAAVADRPAKMTVAQTISAKPIIFANEKKLETNKMFVEGFDITTMACIVHDKLKEEEK